jgi:putative Mg2+ transporter-C (MgtC) family protein
MDIQITTTDMILRVIFSLLLGSVIGLERETKNKPAGLRTNMMVALGSAAFTILTLELFSAVLQAKDRLNVDPLRIIEGVMGGLGFIGAGCIIQSRGSVEGITTAATIWVVGAVGLACGAGHFRLAIVVTLLAFLVLTALRFIEKRVGSKENINGVKDA